MWSSLVSTASSEALRGPQNPAQNLKEANATAGVIAGACEAASAEIAVNAAVTVVGNGPIDATACVLAATAVKAAAADEAAVADAAIATVGETANNAGAPDSTVATTSIGSVEAGTAADPTTVVLATTD